MIAPVILSGGSGTRLWPLSRSEYPKQFLNLMGDSTLFQETINRLPKGFENPLIVCNEEHRFLVAEQLRIINKKTNGIILEPVGKNTAPAVALAALKYSIDLQDPILLVLSADHVIQNKSAFHEAIKIAENLAETGKLVTLGIKPDSPETGYGYIEAKINEKSKFYKIKSFHEKPKKNIAEEYLKSDSYFWNSGIFMFKASSYLKELKKYSPEILSICQNSLKSNLKDADFIRLVNDEFFKCPSNSIDYALMERTKNAFVVPMSAGWSDIGSWSKIHDVKKDSKNNNNVIEGDISLDNVHNSLIYSDNRFVSVIGLTDIILVDTQDALLVLDKKFDQDTKKMVEKLRNENRMESLNHRKVYRPWGYYDSIDSGKDFQVKRISINPKSKLSLQKHKFRSEHWVIISGNAIITCGKKVFQLNQDQSTYIPKGEVHRLENPNDYLLEIIEIQTGSYLGEDDIIRIEDDYKRN
jgi:mannose-1-phosphate guanylyltransferase